MQINHPKFLCDLGLSVLSVLQWKAILLLLLSARLITHSTEAKLCRCAYNIKKLSVDGWFKKQTNTPKKTSLNFAFLFFKLKSFFNKKHFFRARTSLLGVKTVLLEGHFMICHVLQTRSLSLSSLCCIISTALPDASTQTNKLPRCLMLKPWWFPIFTQIRTRCIILCNSRDAKMLKAQEKRMLNKLKKDSSSWSHRAMKSYIA